MFIDEKRIQNQPISLSFLTDSSIELFVKREDQLHPLISGNKFRKLKYPLLEAQQQGHTTLLSFGGAYSNHIAATAAAGKQLDLKTIGVIRGDELEKDLESTFSNNKTLREAKNNGMQFYFVDRETYRAKEDPQFLNELKKRYGNFYLIPEGGTSKLAVKGCEEILTNEDKKFDYICVAVGTGGTIAGLINTVAAHQQVIGFSALKGSFLKDEILKLTSKTTDWSLQEKYHFGGYAKSDPALIAFMNQFLEETGIQLDPIYTGKMFFGLAQMIQKKELNPGSKVLLIHTGGLQGIEAYNKLLAKKQQEIIKVL